MAQLLKHLHSCLRGDGSGAAPAFHSAAVEQQALGAAALREEGAAELAEELLERVEQLVGSKQAHQRQLGLQLLRTAIAHSHRRTFLQQHTSWAALLLATLRSEQQRAQKQDKGQQQPADAAATPSAAAAEACACLAAYFTRIARMLEVPGVRRDGAAAASKLAALLLQQGQGREAAAAVPPLLELLQGQQALLAALTALPASFRQQLKALEAALLPLLMRQGGSSSSSVPLLAACAAALPRVSGDASSWSALCQRVLQTAHRLADLLFLGQDDAQLAGAARAALDPAAEPLPLVPSGTAGSLGNDAYRSAWGQLSAVLHTLQALLGSSYPAPVPVPTGSLLLLVSRVLSVDDGAAAKGGRAAAAAAASARFPQLCLSLPAAQAAALVLLQRLLAACGSAAAPYFVAAARLVGEALQRAAVDGGGALACSAQVRCQLFGSARQLLLTAGIGAVRQLAPALLQAAAAELYGHKRQHVAEHEAEDGPARKKSRKAKGPVAALDGEAGAGAPMDDLGAAVQQRDLAVQAAALQALQALCTAGAPLLAPPQRRQLDDVAAHVAATSAAAARQLSSDAESAVDASLAALHLASYQLLLATLLAPAPHRPAHLAAALQLFRAGCGGGQAGGAALAPFCRNALLSCEALLHPRVLPPPAPVRRIAAAVASTEEVGGEGSGRLGMPRFWSNVDAALLLEQERVVLAAQQAQQAQQGIQQPEAEGVSGAGDELAAELDADMAEAEGADAADAADTQQAQQAVHPAPQPAAPLVRPAPASQPPPAAPAASSMAAMLAGPPIVSASSALPAATPSAAAAPVVPVPGAPQPLAFAAPAPLAPTLTATSVGAVAAASVAAAAAEESDSDGPLPDIDSGGEESGSDGGSD